MRLKLLIALFAVTLLTLMPVPAAAQGLSSLFTAEPASETQSNDLDRILRQAGENGVGVIIVDSNGKLLTQPAPASPEEPTDPVLADGSAVMKIQDGANHFRTALIERIWLLPDAFSEVATVLRAASPDGTILAYGKALFYSLLLFAVGVLGERKIYGRYIAGHFVLPLIKDNPVGFSQKMPFLVIRFLAGVVGIIFSMSVAYVIGFVAFGTIDDPEMQFTVTLINIGYFASRFVAGLWRMILSPYLSQYRIPVLSDAEANSLHRWLWILAMFDIFAILFGVWIDELGLNYDVYAFISSLLSGVIVITNILMVLVNRRAISRALRNGKTIQQSTYLERMLGLLWAPVVIIYVVIAWFELTYDLVLAEPGGIPLIAGAYAILISIIVVYGVINFIIERGFARARAIRRMNAIREEEEAKEAALRAAAEQDDEMTAEDLDRLSDELEQARSATAREETRSGPLQMNRLTTFEGLARRVAGTIAFVVGVYAFLFISDNNSARMVESNAERVLDLLAIIFIGYVIYHAFRIWIDNKIAEEAGDQDMGELGDEGGASSASRLATLLPLFRNFMLIVVVVTILLIVLMEMGINVGPLFAGAGIVGVAVGFGSQALVRDIFAGAFFLFDDAFRKGEYLDVGGVKGTVEKISVRSFQLRHHLGALHTIPFGELQVMTNYSRDWVIMKLPLRVTYDTDVEAVRKMIKKLGVALLDDPVIGENFIQPLKSQGVIEMQDSAMIIRVKFMTKPGDQWLVRKKVYEEIRALFEREGIKFAHREVTVRLADGKVNDLTETEKNAVTAAAQASIEEELMDAEDAAGGDDR